MYCNQCGRKLKDDWTVCPDCGQKVKKNTEQTSSVLNDSGQSIGQTIGNESEVPEKKPEKLSKYWTIRYWGATISGLLLGVVAIVMGGFTTGILLMLAGALFCPKLLNKVSGIKRYLLIIAAIFLACLGAVLWESRDDVDESAESVVSDEKSYDNYSKHTEESDITDKPESSGDLKRSETEVYGVILDEYTKALIEHWDRTKLMDNDLNPLCADYMDPSEIGYTLLDIDKNGVDELLIGGPAEILDMYTLTEGKTKLEHVLSSAERDRYYLCTNGMIANEGSESAFVSFNSFYTYTNGNLVLKESVRFDDETNPASPYYYLDDQATEYVNISQENAFRIINSYEYASIVYTPLMNDANSGTDMAEVEGILIDTEYYTITLPEDWEGRYVVEQTQNDGNGYSVSLYELQCYNEIHAGWFCSIMLMPDYRDFTEFPSYEYLGELYVPSLGNYNVVVLYPTDVQFTEAGMESYGEMNRDIDNILYTFSPKTEKGCIFN